MCLLGHGRVDSDEGVRSLFVVKKEIRGAMRNICTKEANKFSNVNEKNREFA
jgi:hypothetical protein